MATAPTPMDDTGGWLQGVMRALDELANVPGERRKVGLVLLAFPFDQIDKTTVNYVGNGQPEDIRLAILELAKRWEGMAKPPPARPG